MLTGRKQDLESLYDVVLLDMQDYYIQASNICQTAGQPFPEFDWYDLVGRDYGGWPLTAKVCFVLCLELQGENLTISGSLGVLGVEYTKDMLTGDWGVALGVGISAPNDLAAMGATAMFHTKKGVGVGAGVDVGVGPIRLKQGKELWYAFNREPLAAQPSR